MKARMLFFLDEVDGIASLRQQSGSCGAGWTATDDKDVASSFDRMIACFTQS